MIPCIYLAYFGSLCIHNLGHYIFTHSHRKCSKSSIQIWTMLNVSSSSFVESEFIAEAHINETMN